MKRLVFMMNLFEKIVVGVTLVTAIYIPVFYGWKTQIEVNILCIRQRHPAAGGWEGSVQEGHACTEHSVLSLY